MAQLADRVGAAERQRGSAIIGASRPEQVAENVKAAGVKLDVDAMKAIDEALGDVVERDPGQTAATMRRRTVPATAPHRPPAGPDWPARYCPTADWLTRPRRLPK